MMDRVGKIFIAYPPLRKCVICDVVFKAETKA